MKRIAYAVAFTLSMGGAAIAAEGKDKPRCYSLEAMRADLKDAKITPLNPGQFHVLVGAFVVLPPAGPPPAADSALLVQKKGHSLVVWMRGTPACAVDVQPMQVSEAFVAILRTINPGKGETVEPGGGGHDLHL